MALNIEFNKSGTTVKNVCIKSRGTNQVLTVSFSCASTMTRGLKVVQEHWKKEPNQLWNIYHDYDTNFIRLSSVANPAYALDVVDGATYLTPYDEVKAGQKWRYKNGSGVLQNQGKSLDIPNGTHAEGAHLLAFHINHGATNQQWDIIPKQ